MRVTFSAVGATSRSTAAWRCAGARCAYRCTIESVRQPPSSLTVSRSTPAITSREAKVWRLECHT
jgi:hypothetical protein